MYIFKYEIKEAFIPSWVKLGFNLKACPYIFMLKSRSTTKTVQLPSFLQVCGHTEKKWIQAWMEDFGHKETKNTRPNLLTFFFLPQLKKSRDKINVVWTSNMTVWPNGYFISIFLLKEKNCLHYFLHLFAWCQAVGLPLLKRRILEPVWTWRRELPTAAVCVSAGHMISAWLSQSPTPMNPWRWKGHHHHCSALTRCSAPRGERKGSLKWWCVRINKKKGLICAEQHNGELCRAYFIPCANEWIYIVSAQADFCVKYSPFVSRGSLSNSDAGAQDEDECLCIILYSHDDMSDIVAVPSLAQNGCSPPQTQWLCLTLPKTLGTPTFV